MVANRTDPPKPGGSEAAKAAPVPAAAAPKPAEGGGPAAGGLKAWLPLIVSMVAMPVLAYAMTTFVLAPRMARAMGKTPAAVEPGEDKTKADHAETAGKSAEAKSGETAGKNAETKSTEKAAEPEGKKGGGEGGHGGKKQSIPLKKVLVNVAGTVGTRYLMANFSVVGAGSNFKNIIEEHQDQLVDLAIGILSSKTISDLEKPGIRNIIRTELLTSFNSALGNGTVQEIFITDFAVQ